MEYNTKIKLDVENISARTSNKPTIESWTYLAKTCEVSVKSSVQPSYLINHFNTRFPSFGSWKASQVPLRLVTGLLFFPHNEALRGHLFTSWH